MADVAPISYTCEPARAYDFKKSDEGFVGHLVKLSFKSGQTLAQDTEVDDPTNPGNKVKVVGIIEDINWAAVKEKPIQIRFRMSKPNQSLLATAAYKPDAAADVTAEFIVYAYDQAAEKYHIAFSTDGAELNCVRAKDPSTLSVTVEMNPSSDIRNPVNFQGRVVLTAKGQQKLLLAHSVSEKMIIEVGTNG